MSDEPEDLEVDQEGGEAEPVAFADETPREKAMRLRMERLEQQLVEKDAVAFADAMTRGKAAKAYPAERATIIREYRRHAAIDARLAEARLAEPVTFEDGGKEVQGTHLDAYKATFGPRPRVTVRDEKVVGVAFGRELPEEPSESNVEADKARIDREREETQAWARGFNGTAK